MTTTDQGVANFDSTGNSLSFLHEKRKAELEATFSSFPSDELRKSSILEIGSGTGYQLTLLKNLFKSAKGIDLTDSRLRNYRTEDVIEYDGKNIPFDDDTFDFVYSSNVMEHIPHLGVINAEIARVLKPKGTIVHVMPTHSWRTWTLVSGYCSLPARLFSKLTRKQLSPSSAKSSSVNNNLEKSAKPPGNAQVLKNIIFPPRHGERGNFLTEIYYFHPKWWIKEFSKEASLTLHAHRPNGLYYTGWALFNSKMTWPIRRKLSKCLGSACHVYILKKTAQSEPEK